MKEFKYASKKALFEVLDSQKTPEAKLEEINGMLIPVMNSADQLEEFIKEHEEYLIVPFIFGRGYREMLLSTSRIHMNWMWPNVLYVPVNIKKDDNSELKRIYELATKYSNIIFFNHSTPHKSNAVMQEMFEGELGNKYGDYVAKSDSEFIIDDGNGAALVEEANKTPYGTLDFSKITVVIIGIGGTGMLAALRFYEKGVRKDQDGRERLILVDIDDKAQFADEVEAKFYLGIDEILADESLLQRLDGEHLIIIDATKEDEEKRTHDAEKLAEKYQNNNNIFIDCNMYVKRRRYEGVLKGYNIVVGQEFVETTNYIMTKKIVHAARSVGVELEGISDIDFADKKVFPSNKIVGDIENILSKKNNDFKGDLNRELRNAGLSKKQYCKIAWLTVVKALPYLNTIESTAFDYWEKDKKQQYLYSIFYDLDKTAEKLFINEGCELEKLMLDERLLQVNRDTKIEVAKNIVSAARTLVSVMKNYADGNKEKLSSDTFDVISRSADSAYENRIENETFLDIVREDLKNTREEKVLSLKLDEGKFGRSISEKYEKYWRIFLESLRAVDCDYFADVYKHIYDNGFDETAKAELKRRIQVYDKIENEDLEKSAAAMSEILGSQLKKRVEKSWPLIKKIGAILIAIIGFVSAIITIVAIF